MSSAATLFERPLACQILDYLVRHPRAEDTVEGVVQWWLLEQQVRRSVAEAEEILALATAQSLILARRGGDGRTRYRVNPSKTEWIRQGLEAAWSAKTSAKN